MSMLELLLFHNFKHSSALVNLRVHRPSSRSYSCVHCTACDCAYIKT